MAFADLLFCTMSGDSTERLQQRFIVPLQAVDILNTLCAQPLVLRDWFFSEEHCYLTARLLGAFTGFAGVQLCPADTTNFFSVVSVPALLDEAPFLNAILFLMLNRSLPPLALAQCLSRARFGYWSDDRRIFFPERADRGQGLPIGWGMTTKEAHDLGSVVINFEGDRIISFRFSQPWPLARFRPGRHFMDDRFSLEALPLQGQAPTDGSRDRRVKIFKTVRASDSLQHAKPFWHRYFGSISAELETILDGHFTVAKDGLPLRPIFQRNHKSWEDDPYAQTVLMRVLAEWHNAGSLEYVERLHRLPHCILAIGSVPKATPPMRRLVTDCRPINIYAHAWRVKYAAVAEICLMLVWRALLWIRDLKNAYHLIRLGGCRGRTTKLVRWITNESGTGYVPAPTFRSGCGAGDCLGVCDKSMFGMSAGGHISRFAVAQFGHKVSHGPLWVLTEAIVALASRKYGVDIAAFVDDLLSSIATELHDACEGLDGNCEVCRAAYALAMEKMLIIDRILKDCGMDYSDKGDMTIRQDQIFIGIIFDTMAGKLRITVEKFDKTMKLLHEVMHQAEISPRGMAKLRGKFGHQLPGGRRAAACTF
jgi:hypothetical protein